MGNLSLTLFLSIIIPLTMALLVFDVKTRTSILFLMIGILACFFCGELNGILLKWLDMPTREFTVNITPITEEIAKAYPLFLYAFLFKPDRVKLKETAVVIGIGFAILENAFVLASNADSISVGLALIRGFGSGMMHGVCTLSVGYGISFVYSKKKLVVPGSFAMMCIAISFHSIYNNLVQSTYKYIGFALPMLAFIPLIIVIRREKTKAMKKKEEKAHA